MYYLNLDENGYLASHFTVDTQPENITEDSPLYGVPAVESLPTGFDLMTAQRVRAHRWDGERLVLDADRLAALEAEEKASQAAEQIAQIKAKLADTDYVAIKHVEGWITDEEYAPMKAQRQAWRDEINELEGATA